MRWLLKWTSSEQAFGHLHNWFFLCFYLACHLVANQCKATLNNDGAEIASEISLFRCGVLLDWQLSGPRQRQKYQMKSACWTSHSNMQSLIFTFNFSGRQTPASIEMAVGILAGLRAQFPYSFLVHLKWFKVYRICPILFCSREALRWSQGPYILFEIEPLSYARLTWTVPVLHHWAASSSPRSRQLSLHVNWYQRCTLPKSV